MRSRQPGSHRVQEGEDATSQDGEGNRRGNRELRCHARRVPLYRHAVFYGKSALDVNFSV
jgi:hypothetical protein